MVNDMYSGIIGNVTRRESRTVSYDVTISAPILDEGADEYIIRLNGRILRRINEHQARRLGILPPK